MNARPAMPDPAHLVRRSMAHVQRHTGCSWNAAANVVYDVVQEITAELTDQYGQCPDWVDALLSEADRMIAKHPLQRKP